MNEYMITYPPKNKIDIYPFKYNFFIAIRYSNIFKKVLCGDENNIWEQSY